VHAQIHVGPGQIYPTISSASTAKVVHAGDTIYVHAGTYTDVGQAIDSLIGTPTQWIVIRPFQNDSVSIHVQYTFQHAQYLKLYRLNFWGNDSTERSSVFHLLFFDYEYDCFTSNHDIIIDHCNFDELNNTGKGNTGACLKLDGTANFRITNCSFTNGTNITDGISLNADIDGAVQNCRFENLSGDGSHCKGGAKNIVYEQNLFENCAVTGLDIGGDTGPQFFCPLLATWEADSIKVHSNIFIGGNTGVKLSSCHNSEIFNNTCFKTNDFAFRSLNASSNPIYLSNNSIYNNIFTTYTPNHIYMNASSGYDYSTEYFRDNLFHDYMNPDPATINWSEMPGVFDSASIIGDPEFNDTARQDFYLSVLSPAIRAGILLSEPDSDFFGRPFASAFPTIGAVAFFPLRVGTTGDFPSPALGQIYPNPASTEATIEYQLLERQRVWLGLYDCLGNEVLSTENKYYSDAGTHTIVLDVSKLRPGVYFYRLQAGTQAIEGRMAVLR
jgi:hypothetical protein